MEQSHLRDAHRLRVLQCVRPVRTLPQEFGCFGQVVMCFVKAFLRSSMAVHQSLYHRNSHSKRPTLAKHHNCHQEAQTSDDRTERNKPLNKIAL
eukprot:3707180-Amphidinium_carterae.1